MTSLDYIAPTKRRKMTQPRAAKIFLNRNGICFCCGQQIRPGEAWIVEHPDPVAQGGSDDDGDLWPAHEKCRRMKDKRDAADKAKRDRLVTAGWKGKRKSRFPNSRDGRLKTRLTSEGQRTEPR